MSLAVYAHIREDINKVITWEIVASDFAFELLWVQCNCDVLAMFPLLTGLVEMTEVLDSDKLANRCRDIILGGLTGGGVDNPGLNNGRLLLLYYLLLLV
jgi:hypothetical protein